MKFLSLALRTARSLLSLLVVLALLAAGAYSVYALWDNQSIYSAAKNVQSELMALKPELVEGGRGASFAELLAVNPDVCGWITLYDTNIDYPVVQGDNNLTYLNTDVYGNFALAGSIFLDSRNDSGFHDLYNLIYGHHMADNNMFGDLDLYEEEAFFDQNTGGILILPDRSYQLELFACLVVPASEDAIFELGLWQADIDGLLEYAGQNALHLDEQALAKAERTEGTQILALSTCSSDFTDARTIVLAIMES